MEFSFPTAQDMMVNSGDLLTRIVTALFGFEILAGTSLTTSALLVSFPRKSGLNLSAQVDGVMVTGGCFGRSVSFMIETLPSLFYSSAALSVVGRGCGGCGHGGGGRDIAGCDGVNGFWGCCIVVGLVADGHCFKTK